MPSAAYVGQQHTMSGEQRCLGQPRSGLLALAHHQARPHHPVNQIPIASRIKRIKPSPSTLRRRRPANELRRQGKSLVNLVVGEPDFDTPLHIRQAAARAMDAGATRYTSMSGTLELRQAIAAKLARENGLNYAPNEIIATNGAKSAIFNALSATLDPGERLIIVPTLRYWVLYPRPRCRRRELRSQSARTSRRRKNCGFVGPDSIAPPDPFRGAARETKAGAREGRSRRD